MELWWSTAGLQEAEESSGQSRACPPLPLQGHGHTHHMDTHHAGRVCAGPDSGNPVLSHFIDVLLGQLNSVSLFTCFYYPLV